MVDLDASDRGTSMLVLGTAQLGQRYGIANREGQPDYRSAMRILQMAAEGGVAALDTAPAYGQSEALIGRASTAVPVYTKLSVDADPVESVERSIRALCRPRVDLLFLHDPDLVVEDPDGVVDRAASLVGGPVRALGASVYSPVQLRSALLDPRIAAVQVPFSVVDRRALQVDELRRTTKIVLARSVLLQGALLLKPQAMPGHLQPLADIVARVGGIARSLAVTPQAVLVLFARDSPGVTGVILGAETPSQLRENIRLMQAPPLPGWASRELQELPDMPPEVIDPRLWPVESRR